MNNEIKFCRYCGCKVESDMLFCPVCGKNLGKSSVSTQMMRFCSKKVLLFVGCVLLVALVLVITIKNNRQKNVFQEAFEASGGPNFCGEWVTVMDDGSGMKIDTNPGDIKDYYDSDALSTIKKIHSELELPDSIVEKMTSTRALDGRQSQTYNDINISWTYHPTYGLEIIYEYER